MNNPFDYIPSEECNAAYRQLLALIDSLRSSENAEDVNLCRELDSGKMLGVLMAEDQHGNHHTLFAFSGQLGKAGFQHPLFVDPVFDYLHPDGYFKRKEAEISCLNDKITSFEASTFSKIQERYSQMQERLDAEFRVLKERYQQSKMERDRRRSSGIGGEEQQELIRQSQFEKAELRRLKKRIAVDLQPYEAEMEACRAYIDKLKSQRRSDSEALQSWLFTNFKLLNAHGEERSLSQIFADTPIGIPPSGAGECCAPKLLQEAYRLHLNPISIAEYWYGKSKEGEVRIQGEHYPACRGKCLPILSWMLKGLTVVPALHDFTGKMNYDEPEIIFANEWFCVVNKPSGMLSVPGKGKVMSVLQWLIEKYGNAREIKMAHRLDQDTSGLLIATFGAENYRIMQSLFATRKVNKTYVAELDGDYKLKDLPEQGVIKLSLSPDWLDRPRQRVDSERGKPAITQYTFTDVRNGKSRVIFHPRTGRTHQLRVHAASVQGFDMPIVGDRLYGKRQADTQERLYLHAHKLEFRFPIDGKLYSFEAPLPF